MSISIHKAEDKIKILNSLDKQPELILTDLYLPGEEVTSVNNFLYNINFQYDANTYPLHISDFLKKNLSKYLYQFQWYKNCNISFGPLNIINIDFLETIFDERWVNIVKIDLANKKYGFNYDRLKYLKEKCEKEITLNLDSLDDRIKRDLDLINQNYFMAIFTAIKRGIKYHETRYLPLVITILSIPKYRKKLRIKLNNELKDLEVHNKYVKEKYEKDLKDQEIYRKEYPRYEQIFKWKIEQIEKLLNSLGYKKVCVLNNKLVDTGEDND